MTLIERNECETLILTDERVVFFFPRGFAQAFSDPDPEGIFDEHGAEGSLFGYYSESGEPDGDIDLNYQPVLDMKGLREVSEEEARRLHPKLFEHMAAIDRGEDI